MEKMVKEDESGIGFWGFLNPSNEARQHRGEFQSLQAAVLPIFKGLFPRGMTEKEFKYVNDNYLPQPGERQSTTLGKIAGLRRLASGDKSELSKIQSETQNNTNSQFPEGSNVQKFLNEINNKKSTKSSSGKKVFNGNNLEHIQKLRQLEKQFNGDKDKVNEALAREFE